MLLLQFAVSSIAGFFTGSFPQFSLLIFGYYQMFTGFCFLLVVVVGGTQTNFNAHSFSSFGTTRNRNLAKPIKSTVN